MKKTLLTGFACLTASAAAWAASTAIQFNDILTSTSQDAVQLSLGPGASIDKGTRSYFIGYNLMAFTPYITAVNSGTGKTYWSATLEDVDGDFSQITLIGSTVCAGGRATDDNGDGGPNVVVACFQATKGTLLWKKEFENPTDSMSDLQLQKFGGSKGLLVWLYDTDSNDTLVLALDPKTGNAIQKN